MSPEYDLDSSIRKIPDFPKPGILFYDITSILMSPEAFAFCLDKMMEPYIGSGLKAIAAVEARGFLFGAPIARAMGLSLILVRKKGKLPGDTLGREFELEYGLDQIEIHRSDIPRGGKILLVDDLVASGGTLAAAADLLAEGGGIVEDICCVVGLPFLPYKDVLKDYRVRTLIEYDSE